MKQMETYIAPENQNGWDATTDSLGAYLRRIGAVPRLSAEQQNEFFAQIESIWERLSELISRFGFVAGEHIALAGKLVSDPPRERFDRLIDRATNVDREEHLQRLQSLISDVCQLNEQAEEKFRRWQSRRFPPGKLKTELLELTVELRRKFPQFKFKRSLIEAMFPRVEMIGHELQSALRTTSRFPGDARLDTSQAIAELEQKARMPWADCLEVCAAIERRGAELLQARTRIVESHLRLSVFVAKKYLHRGMPLPDLIQEGNLGLLKAVERFEYRRGCMFSTFAVWWIRLEITQTIADCGRTIRIPAHRHEIICRLRKIQDQLFRDLGREPTVEELGDELKISGPKAGALLRIAQPTLSLHSPVDEENGTCLENLVADTGATCPSGFADFQMVSEQLTDILSTLPGRERQILELRFGLNGEAPRTLAEIGRQLNLTRERIPQIEARALRRLRHPSRARKLRGEAAILSGDDGAVMADVV